MGICQQYNGDFRTFPSFFFNYYYLRERHCVCVGLSLLIQASFGKSQPPTIIISSKLQPSLLANRHSNIIILINIINSKHQLVLRWKLEVPVADLALVGATKAQNVMEHSAVFDNYFTQKLVPVVFGKHVLLVKNKFIMHVSVFFNTASQSRRCNMCQEDSNWHVFVVWQMVIIIMV